ncbi:hypothetical protein [Deinococcus fonticola]|uniref:hypothetical protein n=1 Tax=Deinococcus fonticola TaxID=2528713 RepID=UPI001074B19A|nr:hypothetical protein [Deinococcus fonticola]
MSVVSQRVFVDALKVSTPAELTARLLRERMSGEVARGAVIAAEWYAERGVDPDGLLQVVAFGVPVWLHVIGPVAVHWVRPQGYGAVWLPPDGLDVWPWMRALQSLQAVEHLWPGSVGGWLRQGEELTGRQAGMTRLAWARGREPDPLAEVFWRLGRKHAH